MLHPLHACIHASLCPLSCVCPRVLVYLPQALETRALGLRLRTLLRTAGLGLADAFGSFCVTGRTGGMSCSELYSGARWLGLALSEQQARPLP